MATNAEAARLPTWTDPEACPFCGAPLADGGPAFMDHLGDHPRCAAGFEAWRDRVVEDITAGWAG